MATYVFRCAEDGVFEVRCPMGSAGRTAPCPACSAEGVRVYAAPMLGLADRRLGGMIDRTAKTRWEPEVVTSIPPGGRRRRPNVTPSDPALRKLPRP
jgi:hypothetical protein